MRCTYNRWKISRALDSGKPLSGRVEKHLRSCGACREFARLSKELERRLTKDAVTLIQGARGDLGKKSMPAVSAPAKPGVAVSAPSRGEFSRLKPILAAAGLLAAVGISLIWVFTPRSEKLPPLNGLFEFTRPQAYLESALLKAEAPYEEEIQELKRTVKSTADYLRARFDIKLGQ